MRCPSAATTTRRSPSRPASPTRAIQIRRRRRCQQCDKRFTTYERAEIALPAVVREDGTREFVLAKLRGSMSLALRKRPVSVEQIDAAVERIQEKLPPAAPRKSPPPSAGELVMRELKRIDKVAYVRFASVYRSFEDVDEFRQLIRDI